MNLLNESVLSATLLILLLWVLPAHAAPRIVEPIDESARMSLPGHIHPAIHQSVALGHADRALRAARLILVLRSSDQQEQALQAYLDRVQTRGSADYHRWLTE